MITNQIIENIKVRRNKNRLEHNAPIKEEIKAIQRKMVETSFLPIPDIEQHKRLLNELKVAKQKLI